MRALCGMMGALIVVACSHDAPQFVSSNPFANGDRHAVPAMAVAGDQVYWGDYSAGTDACDGALYAAPKSGGPARKVWTGCVVSIVTDGADVYWAGNSTYLTPGEPSRIQHLAPGSTSPATLASASGIAALTKTSSGLYAALYDSASGHISLSAIRRDGGSPQPVITDMGFIEHSMLVADGNGFAWFSPLSYNSASLMRLSSSAAAPTEVATVAEPGGMVSAFGSLWYLDSPFQADAGSLLRISGTSSAPEKVLQTGPSPQALTADANNLYWVERASPSNGGVLVRARPDGGTSVLADSAPPALAQSLAVDDGWIYFASQTDAGDEIWRVRTH